MHASKQTLLLAMHSQMHMHVLHNDTSKFFVHIKSLQGVY